MLAAAVGVALAASAAKAAATDRPLREAGAAAPAAKKPPLVPASAIKLLEVVRRAEAKAVLLNVWATWCLPCREELPDLLRLRRAYAERGLRLVLVSGDFDDQAEAAREFLAEQGVDFKTYLKQGKDQEFIAALSPEWSGALPATFVFGPDGTLRRFHEGKASYRQFESMILEALGAPPPRPEGEKP